MSAFTYPGDEDTSDSERDRSDRSISMEGLNADMLDTLGQMVSRLCSVCRNFFEGQCEDSSVDSSSESDCEIDSLISHVSIYHSSLSSLKESVQIGCPLCRELSRELETLYEIYPQLRELKDEAQTIWCGLRFVGPSSFTKMGRLCIGFFLRGPHGGSIPDGNGRIGTMMFLPAAILGPGPAFGDLSAVTRASSASTIELVQNWHNNCLGHRRCRIRETALMAPPTRLVRVRKRPTGTPYSFTANVCETKHLPNDTTCRYATLTHRWADGKTLKLTKDNLDMLRQEIPVDQLTGTFRDAMWMICQLGIEYIWIDCFCILQGSECEARRDWELEAVRMGEYYQYAECNLAASGYDDNSIGLFGDREALTLSNYPVRMDLTLDHKVFRGFYIRVDPLEFHGTIIKGPLNSRGWVVQERTLSPSILHFTPKQLWWECEEHIFNEAFPTASLDWSGPQIGPSRIGPLDADRLRDEVYESWHIFILHYAGTQLTVATDRFPAVVGIARVYGSLLKDNFIAGMWEGDLLPSLLWDPLRPAKTLAAVKIAPSWSWASLSLACRYGGYSYDSIIDGVCFRVLSENPDFKSDLDSKTFKISGVRGLAMTGPLRRRLLADAIELREFSPKLDVDDISVFSGQNVAGQEWRWGDFTHLLPLATRHSGSNITMRGLLLQQVLEAEENNTFRRLGTFRLRVNCLDQPDDSLVLEPLGLAKEDGKYKPSTIFEGCGLSEFVLI